MTLVAYSRRWISGFTWALVAAVLLTGVRAEAFHEKGVANCSGCHVTHDDSGALVGPSADGGLLIAESPSDVCLLCHAESLGAVLGSDPPPRPPSAGPGTSSFSSRTTSTTRPGERRTRSSATPPVTTSRRQDTS